jgi:hypothetical protein
VCRPTPPIGAVESGQSLIPVLTGYHLDHHQLPVHDHQASCQCCYLHQLLVLVRVFPPEWSGRVHLNTDSFFSSKPTYVPPPPPKNVTYPTSTYAAAPTFTGAAGKAFAASGAGLAGLVGLAAYIL